MRKSTDFAEIRWECENVQISDQRASFTLMEQLLPEIRSITFKKEAVNTKTNARSKLLRFIQQLFLSWWILNPFATARLICEPRHFRSQPADSHVSRALKVFSLYFVLMRAVSEYFVTMLRANTVANFFPLVNETLLPTTRENSRFRVAQRAWRAFSLIRCGSERVNVSCVHFYYFLRAIIYSPKKTVKLISWAFQVYTYSRNRLHKLHKLYTNFWPHPHLRIPPWGL